MKTRGENQANCEHLRAVGVAQHRAANLEWNGENIVFKAIKRYFGKGEFDCDDVADHSSAYIDNELKEDKRSAFQAHLSKCGPCQAFVGTLTSTIGTLSRLPGINAPSALKQSLLDRIHRGN